MGFTENYFQSQDGLSLYYRSYGSGGNVVLCLPGFTRNSKDFHEIASHLATRHQVLCPDLRGRGQSEYDPDWQNYIPAVYVEDAWRLIDQLGVNNLTIIGTSMGGLMAMIMASQRPQTVNAVVLNDIGPEVDPAGYARILTSAGSQFAVKNWPEAVQQCRQAHLPMLPDKPAEFWQEFTRKTYRNNEAGEPEFEMDANVFKVFTEAKPERVGGSPVDPWDAFRAVSMPCLVLRGELSDLLSAKIVGRMMAVKTDLVHVLVPQRGHAPLLDEVEAVTAIDSFFVQLA